MASSSKSEMMDFGFQTDTYLYLNSTFSVATLYSSYLQGKKKISKTRKKNTHSQNKTKITKTNQTY